MIQNETFGLKEATIQKIHSIFKKYPELEKAILYGSRAKGNYIPIIINICIFSYRYVAILLIIFLLNAQKLLKMTIKMDRILISHS